MHFTIQKTLFSNALARAAAIAGTRCTMPVLACVLIKVDEFGCRIIATDLDVSFETYVEHTDDYLLDGLQTLTLCLPAKLLADVVKSVPAPEVCLELEDNQVTISGGTASFTISPVEPDEFPELPEVKGEQFDLTASSLVEILQDVAYCQSKDASKYNLCGCFLKIEPNQEEELFLTAVALDGHRLALSTLPLPGDPRPVPADLAKGIIVSTKGVAEICKTKGVAPVVLSIAGNNLCIATDAEKLYIRLIDGTYPDVDRVIPQNHPHKIEIKREALIDALQRVKIITSKDNPGVNFSTSIDCLKLCTRRKDAGSSASDKVSAWLPQEPVRFTAKADYLLQALEHLTSATIQIHCTADGMAPLLITKLGTGEPLAVIMPMRPDEVE
jgi:DNA polymerase-3 subunit beta